ncbi:type II toxin-antitoxin system VapC family toxin [Sphingomonas sp.]|uniref:type II toxin-antitoxin system VapC family toxin n=1 Tax=Sphingomonas sp. TaxID=28214 RepID=UPI003CC57F86
MLDTVALVTWWGDSPRLGAQARTTLERSSEAMFVSPVSVWEIANKNRLGKLPEFDGFGDEWTGLIRRDAFTLLQVSGDHAIRAGYLKGPHRDPFDRLIAAQALEEGLVVLTNDGEIAAFGCEVLW